MRNIIHIMNWLLLTVLVLAVSVCESRRSRGTWHPSGVSAEEFIRCKGIPCDVWERRQKKMMLLEGLEEGYNHAVPLKGMDSNLSHITHKSLQEAGSDADNCDMADEDDVDEMIEEVKHEKNGTRRRRNIETKVVTGKKKWKLPITWKFDGKHSSVQQSVVRRALSHWEQNTCIRFKEIGQKAHHFTDHLIFTRGPGCWSYHGRFYSWDWFKRPQVINLHDTCFAKFGTSVHEIGHALGLHHHQTRPDRDNYITVSGSVLHTSQSRFQYGKRKDSEVSLMGIPYDFGSVMHYQSFNPMQEKNVMFAKDSRNNAMMGQTTGLSFYDAKIINIVYCKGVCTSSLSQSCLRDGYQDPNNCDVCKCPDGFSGKFCDQVAPSSNGCGGFIDLSRDRTISTPGYPRKYKAQTHCSWLIKVPSNARVQLQFDSVLVYRKDNNSPCNHWVEVKYSKGLEGNGLRFCGFVKPSMLTSEGNEMLVVFKSNFPVSHTASGFRAKLSKKVIPGMPIVKNTQPPPRTTTSRATTQRTTITQRSTPRTTRQTTKQYTATTARRVNQNAGSGGGIEFQCGFETSNGQPSLCGMVQTSDDKFDWTVWKGKTPSDPTGPSKAYKGQYYIFIEASSRSHGDTARIETPSISQSGKYVLTFAYNMYGHHIHKLTVYIRRQATGKLESVWEKAGDQSNPWHIAKVTVTMNKGDKVVFEGVTGAEYTGDTAVDDITLQRSN